MSFSNSFSFGNVLIRELLVLGDTWVDSSLGEHVRLMSPLLGVLDGHLFRSDTHALTDWVFCHQTLGDGSDILPFWFFEGEGLISTIRVDNRIPDSVQLVGTLLIWEWHSVSTEVSSWIL